MSISRSHKSLRLNLLAGELVEVRSRGEILATLDASGRLDGLPFMPEMLEYCGRRVRVFKRADKSCDTIEGTGARRMFDTVHLEGLRCTGQAHGGCGALCLLFWKEAWLSRVESRASKVPPSSVCTEGALSRATRSAEFPNGIDPEGHEVFSCQATELRNATDYMPWWNVTQYIRDLTSRNITLPVLIKGLAIGIFNTIQRRRRGGTYPFLHGTQATTPTATLDLVVGEPVKVKSKAEIFDTLNVACRNRGLLFDVEMLRYCGGQFTVISRPERIINEKTGRLIPLNNCVVLDGATCVGNLSSHPNRLFCPRSIYAYWREVWLERPE